MDEEAPAGTLEPWESLAIEAVGDVIDFWKFKRNHGRVWALLYVRDTRLSAQEIQDALGLSKGAVSMLVRELEGWGVVRRVDSRSADVWEYEAETDWMKMISRVLSEREVMLVSRVRRDLARAEELARKEGVDRATRNRLHRMGALAKVIDRALRAFLSTSRLDLASAFTSLIDAAERMRALSSAPPGRRTAG